MGCIIAQIRGIIISFFKNVIYVFISRNEEDVGTH